MDLIQAADVINRFQGPSLTRRISSIEQSLRGVDAGSIGDAVGGVAANDATFDASLVLKRAASQINVLIHALGILRALPDLLEQGEIVEYVSLGAGNTGRSFDLETDRRVAEFKFINWRPSGNVIRENGLFKDLYLLEVSATTKRKQMFVLEDQQPLRFLRGGWALSSVLSRNTRLTASFYERFGDRFSVVRDYYDSFGSRVELVSLSRLLPERFGSLNARTSDG